MPIRDDVPVSGLLRQGQIGVDVFHYKNVHGVNIFYLECRNPDLPIMVLFHGFPSASYPFRDLMPMLESIFHLIAPDYPGFGQYPGRCEYLRCHAGGRQRGGGQC